MPARIGFARFRREALEKELDRITQMLPQLGVQKAILIGDLATEQVGPESSLDLIMVMDIPGNFTRRMDFFTSHLGPNVGTNFLVYTPEEFQMMEKSSTYIRSALKRGRVIHES